MRYAWTSTLLALALFSADHAWADDAAQARFHDERARAHYEAGRYDDALREFFLEQRLAPNPRIVFNIGVCFDQLRRPNEAFFYFTQYLASADDDATRRTFAKKAIDELRPRVGRIRVETTPPGADVYLDQREHGSYGVTPVIIPVAPGKHRVWLEREGHRVAERSVTAVKGEAVSVTASLVRIEGRLKVTSSTTAEVQILDADGGTVVSGTTPLDRALPPKMYVVEVRAKGFRPRRDIVRVDADASVTHTAPLVALPTPTGELTVTSNVVGAVVRVDGEPRGFSPAAFSDLEAGDHEVALEYPGLQSWSGRLDIRPERKTWLTATLETEPETRRHPATWVAGSLGAAALIAAIPVTIAASNKHAEYERALAASDGTDVLALRNQGRVLAGTADALWIGGAVSLAAGVVLYVLTEQTDVRESSGTISVAP